MARASKRNGLFGQLSFFGLFDRPQEDQAPGPPDLPEEAKHGTNASKGADEARLRESTHEDRGQIREPEAGVPSPAASQIVRGAGEERETQGTFGAEGSRSQADDGGLNRANERPARLDPGS